MDRRDFLKTTSAAAASVAAGATAAEAAAPSSAAASAATLPVSPAVHLGATRLSSPPTGAPTRPASRRNGWPIASKPFRAGALPSRWRLLRRHATPRISTFGSTHDHARHHPAFAFFAGLPAASGLDAARLPAWLAVGGGQMLWDELAHGFGFKPLLAGHTGPSAGLWSNRALELISDLAGAKMFAAGLAADALRSLGAEPVSLPPDQLKAGLSDGRLDAAEWLGPLAAVAHDFGHWPSVSTRPPDSTPAGAATVLTIRLEVWNRLDGAQRAILETCAAAEYQATLAELHAFAALDQHAQSAGAILASLARHHVCHRSSAT